MRGVSGGSFLEWHVFSLCFLGKEAITGVEAPVLEALLEKDALDG